MSVHPDDEALRWDVPLDPSHAELSPDSAGVIADAATQVDDAALNNEGDSSRAAGESAQSSVSSAMLVVYGVFGGVFALYMVGWIIAVSRDPFVQASLFAEIMYQLGETLAIAAPAIWMASVLWLTARRAAIVRVLWLVAGLVVVAPWPFILRGFGA